MEMGNMTIVMVSSAACRNSEASIRPSKPNHGSRQEETQEQTYCGTSVQIKNRRRAKIWWIWGFLSQKHVNQKIVLQTQITLPNSPAALKKVIQNGQILQKSRPKGKNWLGAWGIESF